MGCKRIIFLYQDKNVSLLIPDNFSEKYVRLFVRNPNKTKEAQSAFRKFMQKMEIPPSPVHLLQQPPRALEEVKKTITLQ